MKMPLYCKELINPSQRPALGLTARYLLCFFCLTYTVVTSRDGLDEMDEAEMYGKRHNKGPEAVSHKPRATELDFRC